MLLMGESVYQLSEPTMHEFRLILEFNHFKEVNKDIYNEFSKMKQLLVVMYNNKFTLSELDEHIISGDVTYNIQLDSTIKQLVGEDYDVYRDISTYWVELQDEAKQGQVGLMNYVKLLVQMRLIEINYYRDLYQPISNIKQGSHATYDESVKPSISAIRNNLALHYKSLIFTNTIYTLSELDRLTVSEFEYLLDITTVEKVRQVRPKLVKHNEEFENQLKQLADNGGFGLGIKVERVGLDD